MMRALVPLSLFAVVLAGCVTRTEVSAPQPEPPQPVIQQYTPVKDKRIVIDPSLDSIIHVVKVTSTNGPEGYLKIQVNVQNQTDDVQKFNYKIDWLDADGADLPMAATAPLTWMLLAHETSFLGATAPTPSARNFRMTLVAPGQ
jgi:uncharacterized protein YcfL